MTLEFVAVHKRQYYTLTRTSLPNQVIEKA